MPRDTLNLEALIPGNMRFLIFEKWDFKAAYGGRGGAKSWNFARAVIIHALHAKHIILCAREFQNSMDDSVHAVIKSQIYAMHLEMYFDIQERRIYCKTSGSVFIFRGLHRQAMSLRSIEGITICWIEEAQSVSQVSWDALIPTIRAANAEIWASFNPNMPDDPTSKLFISDPDLVRVDEDTWQSDRKKVVKTGWRQNPWFNDRLERERLALLKADPDAYDHIWEGAFWSRSAASIFNRRYEVRPFQIPEIVDRFFFGADFGFANDPNTLVRAFILDNTLYVDQEAWGLHVEIDDLPAMYAGGIAKKNKQNYPGIEGSKNWPIHADAARPETISYLRGKGFNISAAEKWQGSVEDGIAHLKGFDMIVIHPRCERMAEEARLYSYKVDKHTDEILPVVVDKHNHMWDALRYSLDGYILRRGKIGTWAKLGEQTAYGRAARMR